MGQPLEKLVKFDHIQTPNQEWFRDCGRDGQCGQWWPLFHRCQPRCYSNIGNRNCMDPMEQKDAKRGGHFLYKPTEQVYAKSNRDTFCYGPEALCLRASPRSSSEPRLYKHLCNKTGRCCKTSKWTRDMTSTMEAVSKSDTCRHICNE